MLSRLQPACSFSMAPSESNSLAWDALGTNNLAAAQADLRATCDGINLGLPGTTTALKMQMTPKVR